MRYKKIILVVSLFVLFGSMITGQSYLYDQSTVYYSWEDGPELMCLEERIMILNHNLKQTYTSIYCYGNVTMVHNGSWSEVGDTLVLTPHEYRLHYGSSNSWEKESVNDSLKCLDLKPLRFIKKTTGELKQLPWSDEDTLTNTIYKLWDGIKRSYWHFKEKNGEVIQTEVKNSQTAPLTRN